VRVSQMIQSKYLRKEDLDDELIVTIKALKLEDMPGGNGEQRWVIYFKEQQKGLVANNTTLRVLEKALGDESDAWVGKKVVLYVDDGVTFKGQVVGGLRLRPVKKSALVTPAPAEPTDAESEFDDAIP